MTITPQLRNQIAEALLSKYKAHKGSVIDFVKPYKIAPSAIERLQAGQPVDKVLKDDQLVYVDFILRTAYSRDWNTVRTEVFQEIERYVKQCQSESASLLLCDDCGIGKSYSAKYLSRTMNNVFYVDCSQCSTRAEFIAELARAVGVDPRGSKPQVKAQIKHALQLANKPCVILDEVGDLEEGAARLIKELWNAVEYNCGWFVMGADGLRNRINKSIKNSKVGWAEFFSRFNDRYLAVVPEVKQDKEAFYRKLISDVLNANTTDTEKARVQEIVNKCLKNDSGRITGLRRAETLLRALRNVA